ncbi:MAG: adenine nucleotide alpha hydrolase [Hyphomicrobiales bacterium]|nr:adenine nucleotide alpha hydrolase [Hyphomicrobiales bacterium]
MTDAPRDGALAAVLDCHDSLAIAVSGGVDSMTLATFAHRRTPRAIKVVHAVSPAVPAAASRRVREYAAAEEWDLTVTGAGEFDDRRYRENPADRCYFCKSKLYQRIRSLTSSRIASGANLDDLGDYRPGLIAASEAEVIHPYIVANMTKAMVRALARDLGLADIAALAAQPCLASRVETGIVIDADELGFIERVEARLAVLAPKGATLRCRITHKGVVAEIGEDVASTPTIAEIVATMCEDAGRDFVGIRPYRRGSMFRRG